MPLGIKLAEAELRLSNPQMQLTGQTALGSVRAAPSLAATRKR
jgi:hypothetical protein